MDQNGEEENDSGDEVVSGSLGWVVAMADCDDGGFILERRKMADVEMVSVGGGGLGRMVVAGGNRTATVGGSNTGLRGKMVLVHRIGSVDRAADP